MSLYIVSISKSYSWRNTWRLAAPRPPLIKGVSCVCAMSLWHVIPGWGFGSTLNGDSSLAAKTWPFRDHDDLSLTVVDCHWSSSLAHFSHWEWRQIFCSRYHLALLRRVATHTCKPVGSCYFHGISRDFLHHLRSSSNLFGLVMSTAAADDFALLYEVKHDNTLTNLSQFGA